MKICVLNASNPTSRTLALESDEYVDYRDGKLKCFNGDNLIKRASSWHSWAYATEGEFFVYQKSKWEGALKYDAIIILVNRDMLEVIPLIKKLKLARKQVAISFHEGVQDLTAHPSDSGENVFKRIGDLISVVKHADCYLNLFPSYNEFFWGMFGRDKVKSVLHSGMYEWLPSFKTPPSERPKNILIGTRTFSQRLLRNTLMSTFALSHFCKENNYKFSLFVEDPINIAEFTKYLDGLGVNNVEVVKGPMKKWEDWVQFISQFRAIYHADYSLNFGQLCLDGALVDTVCVGSTTTNNILARTDDTGRFDVGFEKLRILMSCSDVEYLEVIKSFKHQTSSEAIKRQLESCFK